MKEILNTLIGCFTDLTKQLLQTNSPEFKTYNLYIIKSGKIKNKDVASGMALAASVIETLDQRMGTLTLAIILAGDIKLADNDELGGFMAGADLVMNNADKLWQCSKLTEESVSKALLHTFGHLPKEEMVNKCYEVLTMAEEIESALKK